MNNAKITKKIHGLLDQYGPKEAVSRFELQHQLINLVDDVRKTAFFSGMKTAKKQAHSKLMADGEREAIARGKPVSRTVVNGVAYEEPADD